MYKRIYEIEKFDNSIKFFTENIKKVREHTNLRLLRKFWIINENPLPLVQNKIYEILYWSNEFKARIKLLPQSDKALIEMKDFNTDISFTSSIHEFFSSESIGNQNFLLEQLTLEADLWYGRNQMCKQYFK